MGAAMKAAARRREWARRYAIAILDTTDRYRAGCMRSGAPLRRPDVVEPVLKALDPDGDRTAPEVRYAPGRPR